MLLQLDFFLTLLREIVLLNNIKGSLILGCNLGNTFRLSKTLQNDLVSTCVFNLNYLKNFSSVEKSLSFNLARIGAIVDLDCGKKSVEVLREMSEKNKFNETFVWILYSSASLEDNLNVLNKVKFQWDSEVFLLSREREFLVRVSELYRIKYDDSHPISVNFMGFWDGRSFNISDEFKRTTKFRRRLDLVGTEIYGAVTIFRVSPGFTVIDMLERSTDSAVAPSAIGFAHLKDIMRRVNATLVLRRTSSWSKLNLGPNETWGGTVGMLNTSLADLSVTPMSTTLSRIAYVYSTPPIWVPQYGFVFRHPRQIYMRDVFLQPFAYSLWLAIIAILFLIWAALVLILKLRSENEASPGFAFLGIFGTVVQQSLSGHILSHSGRLLVTLSFLFSFICYQFYATFIVASLITVAPKTIRTMEDLANSRLRIGVNDATYNDEFFNATPITRKIYLERVKQSGNYFTPQKGIELIKDGGFAYHFDTGSIYEGVVSNFSEDQICDLQEITFLPVIPSGLLVRKTSPFREIVNVLMRRLTEVGVVAHEPTKWFVSRPKCFSSHITVTPVDLEHIFTPIAIILGAVMASLLILLAELYVNRRAQR